MLIVGKEIEVGTFKDALGNIYLRVYVFSFQPGNVIALRWAGGANDYQIKQAHEFLLPLIEEYNINFLLGDVIFFSSSFGSEYLANYFKQVFAPKLIKLGVLHGAIVEIKNNPLVSESYTEIKKELGGEQALYERFSTLKKAFQWFWSQSSGEGIFDKEIVYSDDTTEEYIQTQAAQLQEMELQNKRLYDENKNYKIKERKEGRFKRAIRNLVIAFTVLSFLNNVFWRYLDYQKNQDHKQEFIKVLKRIDLKIYEHGKTRKRSKKPKLAKQSFT